MLLAIIDNVEFPVTSPKLIKELNELDYFEGSVPNTDRARDVIDHDDTIEVFLADEKIFSGVIVDKTIERDFLKVTAYQEAVKLSRTIFEKDQGQADLRRVEYSTTAANTILNDILLNTGFTVASAPTDAISIRFEHLSRLDCVKQVARALGKDWWFDGTSLYVGDKGVSKGSFDYFEVESRKIDPHNIINEFRVIFYSRDKEDSVTVTDAASQSTWGVRAAEYQDRNIFDATTANKFAGKIITESKDPIEVIKGFTDHPSFFSLAPKSRRLCDHRRGTAWLIR